MSSEAAREVYWIRHWMSKLDADLIRRAREQRAIIFWWRHFGVSILFPRRKDGEESEWLCGRNESGRMVPLLHKDDIEKFLVGCLAVCATDGMEPDTLEAVIASDENFGLCIAEGSAALEYL